MSQVYARKGSWLGKQNDADAWSHLIVNTTIHRPVGYHNRSVDGPFIPVTTKRGSAIVPRRAFTTLEVKAKVTWSLYVCTSLANFCYILGSHWRRLPRWWLC